MPLPANLLVLCDRRAGIARAASRRPDDDGTLAALSSLLARRRGSGAVMEMEKRALIAAVISAVFIAWYSQAILKWNSRPPQAPSQTQALPVMEPAKPAGVQPLEHEDVIVLESKDLRLEIGRLSGALRRVVMKQFLNAAKTEPVSFASRLPLLQLELADDLLLMKPVAETSKSVLFEAETGEESQKHYHINFELYDDKPLLHIYIRDSSSVTEPGKNLVVTATWTHVSDDTKESQYNQLDADILTADNGGKQSHVRHTGASKNIKNVPRGTLLASLGDRYFCQSIRPSERAQTQFMPSQKGTTAAQLQIPSKLLPDGQHGYELSVYLGPKDHFRMKDEGFAEAYKVGTIGQIGLGLLVVLGGIAGIVRNYGVAVVIFSGIITVILAPFTVLGLKSMKKMQELKPHVDRIMAQHKGDTQRANQEIYALYKTHRVSPLSGCLPMLLQMPIFIALFQALSHYIELRGQSFLWIKDLSMPDRLAKLPISLPFLGSDFNLLPILMAGAMYVQSRLTQPSTGVDKSNPAMAMMSGPFMSVMFGVMFYSVPAALVMYWLTNTMISVAWYRRAK